MLSNTLKAFVIFCALLFSISFFANTTLWNGGMTPVTPTDGTDTLYEIRTPKELAWVAAQVNRGVSFKNSTIKLMNDLDLSCNAGANSKSWIPIGKENCTFQGTFEGDSHIIKNLYINAPESNYIGLFGYTEGATIQNVGLVNVNVTGARAVGGLVGVNYMNATITGCYATGAVTGTGTLSSVGGLVGENTEGATITGCYATGAVTGKGNNVGGLVGANMMTATITGCYATGAVKGSNMCVGGLVGVNAEDATITNCYATGTVTGKNYVGGLVGANYKNATITKSYATGNVDGVNNVGGLVGRNFDKATITGCYATGAVKGSNMCVGGLVGYNTKGATILNCYDVRKSGFKTGLVAVGGTETITDVYILELDQVIKGDVGKAYNFVKNSPGVLCATPANTTLTLGNTTYATVTNDAKIKLVSYGTDTGKFIVPNIDSTFELNFSFEPPIWNGTTTKVTPAAGTDTLYKITTPKELAWVASQVNSGVSFKNSTIQLMNDLDLNGASHSWIPIGNADHAFQGTFEGDSHTIKNLYIHTPTSSYIGLFGKIQAATIKNVKLENVNITGNDYVGGLIGVNGGMSGTITNCHATGMVTGANYVGGLVGINLSENATISNCHATATVTGEEDYIGGFVGYNNTLATISNCYATGAVKGDSQVGGFAGYNAGTISNCYEVRANGIKTNLRGVGTNKGGTLTDVYILELNSVIKEDIVNSSFFVKDSAGKLCAPKNTTITLASNDFATATDDTQFKEVKEGKITETVTPSPFNLDATVTVSEWGGTTVEVFIDKDVYKIYKPEELAWVAEQVNSGFTFKDKTVLVMNDLDLNGASHNWTPIGKDTTYFKGTFNGQKFSIKNLKINSSTVDCIGLFGRIQAATIKNVKLENVNITGNNNVGGLVGQSADNASTITDCYATGSISGKFYVGGLVGTNFAQITNCYATTTVTVTGGYVGGLAGYNGANATITDCYATGLMTGPKIVGGLVGWNKLGTISNCYATGAVTWTGTVTPTNIGGLVGLNDAGTISNCYNVRETESKNGLVAVGLNTSGTIKDVYILELNQELKGDVGKAYNFVKDSAGVLCATPANTTLTFENNIFASVTKDTQINLVSYGTTSGTVKFPNINSTFNINFTITVPVWNGGEIEVTPEKDLYKIYTPNQLAWVASQVNKGISFKGKTFKVMNDLDLSGNSGADSHMWKPIGNSVQGRYVTDKIYNSFQGTFEGDSHIISNLYINAPDSEFIGLFGLTLEATIQNVKLENVNLLGRSAMGGLVGQADSSTITDCYATGAMTATGSVNGGLVGQTTNLSTISNCYAKVTVTGKWSGVDTDFVNELGGLVGYNAGSTIMNCYAKGSVTGAGKSMHIGGLVGFNNCGTIMNCYAKGDVNGYSHVGGLVGVAWEKKNKITNCYATGTVIVTGKGAVKGGLVGQNYFGTITNCYDVRESEIKPKLQAIGYSTGTIKDVYILELNQELKGNLNDECFFVKDSTGVLCETPKNTDIVLNDPSIAIVTKDTKIKLISYGTTSGTVTFPNINSTFYINFTIPALVWDGEETEVTPTNNLYKIYTPKQLAWVASQVNSGETFKDSIIQVMNDLDLSGNAGADSHSWSPIGQALSNTVLHPFGGTFDGGNHIIKNLYINAPGKNEIGLFGFINEATIKDIKLENVNVIGYDYVGGLVGTTVKSPLSTITNCYATGKVSGNNQVGGLVGTNRVDLTNCYATGEVIGVTGKSGNGGLVGFQNAGKITNCYDVRASGVKTELNAIGVSVSGMDLSGVYILELERNLKGNVNSTYNLVKTYQGVSVTTP